MLENIYEGSNARPKVYLSKEYFCEMYPTCVSSKLCEFIYQEKCMFEIRQERRCNNYHLFFQEERLNQGLNLCWDDNLGLLLVYLPLHLHNGGPAPVPDVIVSVPEVIGSAVFSGTMFPHPFDLLVQGLQTLFRLVPKAKPLVEINHFMSMCKDSVDGRRDNSPGKPLNYPQVHFKWEFSERAEQ